MSADNGIYIAHFADGEIRVIHDQAIENCWYPDGENAQAIVDYFGDAKAFNDPAEASECAFEKEKEILDGDFPILEYGISTLRFSKPFQEYVQEAKKSPKIDW
jgi:hypothetical protein